MVTVTGRTLGLVEIGLPDFGRVLILQVMSLGQLDCEATQESGAPYTTPVTTFSPKILRKGETRLRSRKLTQRFVSGVIPTDCSITI